MPVVLTSFQRSKEIIRKLSLAGAERIFTYSVARFQPKGFNYEELKFLAANGKNGKLLLRNFKNPVRDYAEALKEGYLSRWNEIKKWLDSLKEEETIILCCWCPHSSQTNKQIDRFGTFCCHTGLIGKMINKHRPDITVVLDDDRDRYLVEEWKPNNYKTIDELINEKLEKIEK